MRISDWSSDVCSSDLLTGVSLVQCLDRIGSAQHCFRNLAALGPEDRNRPLLDLDACLDQFTGQALAITALEIREDDDLGSISRSPLDLAVRRQTAQVVLGCCRRWRQGFLPGLVRSEAPCVGKEV